MEFQPQQTDETMLPDAFDPDEVDHGSMYYIMHWGAYKGHIRGIIRGLIIGCAIGAVVGLGFAGLVGLGLVSGVALGVGTLAAGFSALGGLMAAGIMGRVGNAAGNAAAQLAETELRLRYPELTEISLDSPEPGYGHHFEVPADRDRGKWFHPRVMIAGILMGGGFGALLSASGIGAILLHTAASSTINAAIIGGSALLGSSFGINRSHFKSVFNFTDNLLQGKLRGPSAAEIAKDKERYRLQGDEGPPSVITSLQRQEEFYRLYEGYYKKAFEAGFAGNARGLIGGLVSGGLLGMALGGVAAAGILTMGVVGAPALAVAAFVGITAFTMKMAGTHFFTEAAFEAAGHSHVHEIFEERVKGLRKGQDVSFDVAEEKINERRRADPDMTPPDALKKVAFKPRVALILGGLGALAGLGLVPIATQLASFLGMGHLSYSAAAAAFGLTGATFGLGPKITESLHGLGDAIYHGTFNPGNEHPDIKTQGRIPLMSPRSELAEHFGKHLEKTLPHHQPDISLPSQEVPQPSRQQQEILERGARRFTDLAQPLPDNPGVNR